MSRSSRVLDVGCGQGALLLHLARFGFTDLQGIDPFLTEAVIDLGTVRLDRRALAQEEGSYSAIFFNHSLEHLDRPVGVLSEARDRLLPGGVIIVDLPIVGGRAWRRFRDNWVGMDAPLHRFIPSPTGMSAIAASAGLRVVRWRGTTPNYHYSASMMIKDGASPLDRSPHAQVSAQVTEWSTKQARKERDTEAAQASFVLTRISDGG